MNASIVNRNFEMPLVSGSLPNRNILVNRTIPMYHTITSTEPETDRGSGGWTPLEFSVAHPTSYYDVLMDSRIETTLPRPLRIYGFELLNVLVDRDSIYTVNSTNDSFSFIESSVPNSPIIRVTIPHGIYPDMNSIASALVLAINALANNGYTYTLDVRQLLVLHSDMVSPSSIFTISSDTSLGLLGFTLKQNLTGQSEYTAASSGYGSRRSNRLLTFHLDNINATPVLFDPDNFQPSRLIHFSPDIDLFRIGFSILDTTREPNTIFTNGSKISVLVRIHYKSFTGE